MHNYLIHNYILLLNNEIIINIILKLDDGDYFLNLVSYDVCLLIYVFYCAFGCKLVELVDTNNWLYIEIVFKCSH